MLFYNKLYESEERDNKHIFVHIYGVPYLVLTDSSYRSGWLMASNCYGSDTELELPRFSEDQLSKLKSQSWFF